MNKGVLLRLAIKVVLLLVAIFVFINVIKIIISQSLFFIRARFGDALYGGSLDWFFYPRLLFILLNILKNAIRIIFKDNFKIRYEYAARWLCGAYSRQVGYMGLLTWLKLQL